MPRGRRSYSFLSPCLFAAFGLCVIAILLGMLSFAAQSTGSASAAHFKAGEPVAASEFSGDLRDLPQTITEAERKTFIRPLELDYPRPAIKTVLPGASSAAPSSVGTAAPMAPMPTPINSFDGMNYNLNGAGHPPDTVGDVGPNHFVQAVNTSIGIYDKATGAAMATISFNTLWANASSGTSCDTFHGGDPTVIYVPQFRADDAAHPWFADYPKMGIWPDGLLHDGQHVRLPGPTV